MSTLQTIVAKFRKGSPNIAAAFDEVERRLVALEQLPPEPLPGRGAKLPPAPTVIATPPTRVETVTANASGETVLTGSDTVFRFTPGTTGGRVMLRDLNRCVVDLSGLRSVGAHDGIKVEGRTRDLHVKGFDIASVRYQGILGVGDAQRVWLTDGAIRDNDPDRAWAGWYNLAHAMYLGGAGGPWREWVVGNVRVTNQRTGYAFHAYDNATDGVVTTSTFNVPADFAAANNGYAGAACIAAGVSQRIKVALTIATGCRYQFAVGGAGCVVPCIELIDDVELNRQGTWGSATPGAVVGTPGTNPSVVGDPGYRLPWDPRATGAGAF